MPKFKQKHKTMNDSYIMMIDGKCLHILAVDRITAYISMADQLNISFDQFLNDINICEYKNSQHRIVEWFNDGKIDSVKFDRNTPFELAEYCNTKIQSELYSTYS